MLEMPTASRGYTLLDRAPRALLIGLIAARVLAMGAVVWDNTHDAVVDVDILRATRIATSPATPYRDFAVEYMPLETLIIHGIGTDGAEATAVRLALLAFAGDLAAAGALAWGWGRRPAVAYLLLGLPLLSLLYQRFDFVVVGLAAWAMALERRGRETASGLTFAVAILAKLWPIVLVPVLLFRRRWRALIAGGVVGVAGGLAWFLVGGPKGPLQVMSFRNAVGWSVESTVGNLVWIVGRGQIGPDAGAMRVGVAPSWAKGLLLICMLVTEYVVWRRAAAEDRDPAGGTALVAVTALVTFSPLFSIQYATWMLPWAAIAFDGDLAERRAAAIAAVVVVLCGVLTLSYLNHSPLTPIAEKVLLFVRNLACVVLIAQWLLQPRRMFTRIGGAAAS
jgi:Glycosyltransferase family 87